MRRSLALIVAGSLTAIVGLVGCVTILATFATPNTANPVNAASTGGIMTDSSAEPRYEIEIEATIQAREAILQAQLLQHQQSLTELDTISQAQVDQLQAQLIDLQRQIEQMAGKIPDLQIEISTLQQIIEHEDIAYKNELTTMTNKEHQLRQELEQTTQALNTAYNELIRQRASSDATQDYRYYDDDDYEQEDDDDDIYDDNDDDDDYEQEDDD